MPFLKKNADHAEKTDNGEASGSGVQQPAGDAAIASSQKITFMACFLGLVASIGGFMFGYESGQISGFLEMDDFKQRFGENGEFSATRSGAIVGLLA